MGNCHFRHPRQLIKFATVQHAARSGRQMVSSVETRRSPWRTGLAMVGAVLLVLAWIVSPLSRADQTPENTSPPVSADALTREQLDLGRLVFHRKCAKCHVSGREGAPVVGRPGEWKRRLEQPTEMLVKHAIDGHQGRRGRMPPKGDFATLSNAEVTAAVQYIVARGEWLADHMKSSRVACEKSSTEEQCPPADASDSILLRMLWILSETR